MTTEGNNHGVGCAVVLQVSDAHKTRRVINIRNGHSFDVLRRFDRQHTETGGCRVGQVSGNAPKTWNQSFVAVHLDTGRSGRGTRVSNRPTHLTRFDNVAQNDVVGLGIALQIAIVRTLGVKSTSKHLHVILNVGRVCGTNLGHLCIAIFVKSSFAPESDDVIHLQSRVLVSIAGRETVVHGFDFRIDWVGLTILQFDSHVLVIRRRL